MDKENTTTMAPPALKTFASLPLRSAFTAIDKTNTMAPTTVSGPSKLAVSLMAQARPQALMAQGSKSSFEPVRDLLLKKVQSLQMASGNTEGLIAPLAMPLATVCQN